jgi:hypothetical protein
MKIEEYDFQPQFEVRLGAGNYLSYSKRSNFGRIPKECNFDLSAIV